jgi:hypothetical protein
VSANLIISPFGFLTPKVAVCIIIRLRLNNLQLAVGIKGKANRAEAR